MRYTTKTKMRLPEYNDVVDIEDLNANFETTDEHIGGEIMSPDGVHGLRYIKDKSSLEVFNKGAGEWNEVSSSDNLFVTESGALFKYEFRVLPNGVLRFIYEEAND